jgi:hypothetical protein
MTLESLCMLKPVVCVKLQGAQLRTLPHAMQGWLQQLQQQGRLRIVLGSHQATGTPHSCTWMCISVTRQLTQLQCSGSIARLAACGLSHWHEYVLAMGSAFLPLSSCL